MQPFCVSPPVSIKMFLRNANLVDEDFGVSSTACVPKVSPQSESLTDVAVHAPQEKGSGAGACDGACVYDTFMLSVVDELLYEKSEFYSNWFIFYFSWS